MGAVGAGKEEQRGRAAAVMLQLPSQTRTSDFTHVPLMEAPATGHMTEGSVLILVRQRG